MKKAYVKPVFLAEAYEMTSSVAGCPTSSSIPRELIYGQTSLCDHCTGGAVQIDKKDNWDAFKDYATEDKSITTVYDQNGNAQSINNGNVYLFTSNTVECDYIWNSNDNNEKLQIWKSNNISERLAAGFETLLLNGLSFSLSKFFCGDEWAGSKGHHFGYNNSRTFS